LNLIVRKLNYATVPQEVNYKVMLSMGNIPKLNGVARALENYQVAFTTFSQMDIHSSIAISSSKFDGVIFEGEHSPWDVSSLRDSMQFLLDRREIVKNGSIAPGITPMVRIPANGEEMSQWHAKQALDAGVYGVLWPHISTVEEAYNAVASCRYPSLKSAPLYEPRGIRGDGPVRAARYWGLSQQEYYQKAGIWSLDPEGEILVVVQIEDTKGIENLDDILSNVPGIGVILIGEGDLGQELGFPRQYDHPLLLEAIAKILDICKKYGVAVGHAHADENNMQKLIEEGFRFIMTTTKRSDSDLEKGLELTGRK
jgi:4-hydroxy-2-oxoheptanedioate aldolase|tara:strand:+ start:1041 stop:1976 length:936 start_codon:yes stop_codon:yes gene_type:complete